MNLFKMRTAMMAGLMALVAVLAAGGCSLLPVKLPVKLPERPELPVSLEFSITADQLLNPTEQGRSSPALVRLFLLSEQTFFQSADFFTLLGEMDKAQHAEVIDIHELMLMPAESKQWHPQTNPKTRFVGVAVAYRDLEGSVWRSLTATPPPKRGRRLWTSKALSQRYRIVVGENSVSIEEVAR